MNEELTNTINTTVREHVGEATRRINLLLTAVVVVLFVGFFGVAVALGGIAVDSFRSKEASYSDLTGKVIEQNGKIEAQEVKVQALTTKIDNLIYRVGQL